MEQEPTNKEILEAVNKLGTRIETNEKGIADVLEAVNDFSTKIDKDIGVLKSDVGTLKSDVAYLKSNMLTKDDLERSQAKQKGEIILTMRKGDIKLRELIAIMHGKQMLTDTEVQHLVTMEPFAQLSV